MFELSMSEVNRIWEQLEEFGVSYLDPDRKDCYSILDVVETMAKSYEVIVVTAKISQPAELIKLYLRKMGDAV